MIIAATGHRPPKLGGYDLKTRRALGALAVEYLRETRPTQGISGMALGWDQAFAAGCIALDIPFVAAIPFEGQERRWPEESQTRYRFLLSHASETEIVVTGEPFGKFVNAAMQARDEWMVDHSDRMCALWDGSWGGTFNTVMYAKKVGRPIDNLWDRWALPADIRELLG